MKQLIIVQNIDLVGMTEVNKYLRTGEYENAIWGTASSWRETKQIQVAQNKDKPADKELLIGGAQLWLLMIWFSEFLSKV